MRTSSWLAVSLLAFRSHQLFEHGSSPPQKHFFSSKVTVNQGSILPCFFPAGTTHTCHPTVFPRHLWFLAPTPGRWQIQSMVPCYWPAHCLPSTFILGKLRKLPGVTSKDQRSKIIYRKIPLQTLAMQAKHSCPPRDSDDPKSNAGTRKICQCRKYHQVSLVFLEPHLQYQSILFVNHQNNKLQKVSGCFQK